MRVSKKVLSGRLEGLLSIIADTKDLETLKRFIGHHLVPFIHAAAQNPLILAHPDLQEALAPEFGSTLAHTFRDALGPHVQSLLLDLGCSPMAMFVTQG